MSTEIRKQLLQFYLAGVRRVRGFESVRDFMTEYALDGEAYLVAIGKAASSMSLGALAACDQNIKDGLVITKHHHLDAELKQDSRIQCFESDHPVPGNATLSAGHMLVKYLEQRVASRLHFLFLISGGASSLVEVLPEGMCLDDLRNLNATLLASGLDIGQMNRVRCALSQIKGGRLARYLQRCSTLNLLISDVPGDDPGVVGSGLLVPSDGEIDLSEYPDQVTRLFKRFQRVAVPEEDYFENIDTHIIARLEDAKKAVAEAAKSYGYDVVIIPEFLSGDAVEAAQVIYRTLKEMPGKIVIWGGETTVTLPDNPGRGGRNQHLALALAEVIQETEDLTAEASKSFYVLCAGTDGTDGVSSDAGGLVDSYTISRGKTTGFEASDYLRRADAGTFLAATGDLVTTGPTGTNVMDIVIGINDV